MTNGLAVPVMPDVSECALNADPAAGWTCPPEVCAEFPEVCLITQRGHSPSDVTLQGLFTARGEALDPIADAATEPGVFSPLCGFTGALVLHGGGCRVDFGWYNALESGAKPPDTEIYPLVPRPDQNAPADDPLNPNHPMNPFNCRPEKDFCPLATWDVADNWGWLETDWPQNIVTFSAAAIRNDARYLGGLIGFALKGHPDEKCKQTKFSQRELNTICTACTPSEPWITTIIYQSTTTPDAFYVAFEDLPNGEMSFTNAGADKNDGDFNDFVYFITGLTCDGAGQPCATDQLGACANGITSCAADGSITCNPVVTGGPELCDNIDNDCNGVVDDGMGLCPGDQVCYRGACVPPCGTGEFQCGSNEICQDSVCVDPLCAGVPCPVDQVCRAGMCVGACDGVVCPHGQECQLGRCVDLCAAANCPAEEVCEQGVCVRNCSCRTCPAGTECAVDGHCKESACKDVSCPAGQYCSAGTCLDACSGAMCPGGALCVNGACEQPMPGSGGSSGAGATGGSGGTIVLGGSSGTGPVTGGSGPGAGGSGPGSGGAAGSGPIPSTDPGCACSTPRAQTTNFGIFSLAGLSLLLGLRRRRAA